MQVVEFLFGSPLGQTVAIWTIIVLSCITGFLIFWYFWTMIKGGIQSRVLYVKGEARFGRIYKCTDSDTAIEVGNARFLKPRMESPDKTDEEGKPLKVEQSPPLTYWRRLRAIKLYLVVEGDPQVKSWHSLVEQSTQPAMTPEQLKKDPQVKAVVEATKEFGRGGARAGTLTILLSIGFGFFVALALCALQIIPIDAVIPSWLPLILP